MQAGESKTLTWRIHETKAASYGDFVAQTWQYCFDQMQPQPLTQQFTVNQVKAQLCNYFRESYISEFPLKFNSGITILTDDCKPSREVQLGFCGRVLLNAFNEVEWGEAHDDKQLVDMGHSIIKSFMQNGFTDSGYFFDFVNFNHGMPQSKDVKHSIRQQSEAVYAMLHYLKYELILKSPKTDNNANLRIFLDSKNAVALEHISLFPVNTFKNRENGMRRDLGPALADVHPGVLRFPGGCIVEGETLENRYQWKNTIGPVENRHQAPFNMKYLVVENEQWENLYFERLKPFVKAIKVRYPHIQLIGTSGPDSEGEAFEHGWKAMTELTADLVDEHLLRCLPT